MPKRGLDNSSALRANLKTTSDFDANCLNSEYDRRCESAKVRRCSERIKSKPDHVINDELAVLPIEDKEHSYSCIPMFKNITPKSGDDNLSGCTSESDCENEKFIRGRRISERSTSSESLKSGACKSVSSDGNYLSYSSSKRKAKCFSKNAVMARMNRIKKKEYLTGLEDNVKSLKENNKELKTKLDEKEKLISSLCNEIQYLRGVLANSKEIGVLLSRVCGENKDPKAPSSFVNQPLAKCDENIENDADKCEDLNELDWPVSPTFDSGVSDMEQFLQCETQPDEEFNLPEFEQTQSFGVCLHVANKQVSLEFCASCNNSASTNNNYATINW